MSGREETSEQMCEIVPSDASHTLRDRVHKYTKQYHLGGLTFGRLGNRFVCFLLDALREHLANRHIPRGPELLKKVGGT